MELYGQTTFPYMPWTTGPLPFSIMKKEKEKKRTRPLLAALRTPVQTRSPRAVPHHYRAFSTFSTTAGKKKPRTGRAETKSLENPSLPPIRRRCPPTVPPRARPSGDRETRRAATGGEQHRAILTDASTSTSVGTSLLLFLAVVLVVPSPRGNHRLTGARWPRFPQPPRRCDRERSDRIGILSSSHARFSPREINLCLGLRVRFVFCLPSLGFQWGQPRYARPWPSPRLLWSFTLGSLVLLRNRIRWCREWMMWPEICRDVWWLLVLVCFLGIWWVNRNQTNLSGETWSSNCVCLLCWLSANILLAFSLTIRPRCHL